MCPSTVTDLLIDSGCTISLIPFGSVVDRRMNRQLRNVQPHHRLLRPRGSVTGPLGAAAE